MKPLAVVVGFVGKLPVAGMTVYNTHHVTGLLELGYDVHYVECQVARDECYDPRTNEFGDDCTLAVSYLQQALAAVGVPGDRTSFVDLERECHGSGWTGLEAALDRADFLITIGDPVWIDEFGRCERRAFIDCDPLFTQARMLEGEDPRYATLAAYGTLFSYCTRFGEPGCSVPDAGRTWIAARPVIATRSWEAAPLQDGPYTNVMNWGAWGEVELEGRSYGHKSLEFEKFIDLPSRSGRRILLAIGGPAPRERLEEHGWELTGGLEATRTLEDYRAFLAGSRADLGIAKHAYVESRCGWFSDRSTCYLASGRPVLLQDTGYTDWLPTGEGVLAFSDLDSLLDAIERLEGDYERHARAARRIAEEHFEARTVISDMLDAAGFR